MKIKRLALYHFRRFTHIDMPFHDQMTVLVARNGAGKTSILDGLAIALGAVLTRLPGISGLNPKDTDFQVFPNGTKPAYMRIECETTDGVHWDKTEKRDKTQKTAKEIPPAKGLKQLNEYVDSLIDKFNSGQDFDLPVLIYYGTGRGVFEIPQRKRGFKKAFTRFDALRGALESRTNFKSFVEYFYSLEDIENKAQKEAKSFDVTIPELQAIRRSIEIMMPGFSNPRGSQPAGIAVDWQQVDGTMKTLKIEQLSDGYRTTLAMVMDIAARMAEANPKMPDPLQTEGVVMIDEVDLHLHPGWQQTILLDLMKTFPNIQWIVSTHSPQVISSVKPECLRVLDWQGDEPSIKQVAFSEGAEAQQMLLDVLGVSSPRVDSLEIVHSLKRYQELVEQDLWDTPEAQKLKSTLDIWGNGYEPELLRLEMDVRMKAWEREQRHEVH